MRSSASSNRIISSPILARASVSSRSSGSPRIHVGPACPARETPASSSRARARAPGSRARPHPAPRHAAAASPTPSCAPRSSAPAARVLPPPAVHCQESASACSFPSSDLLGSRHRSRDSVQRDRVRFRQTACTFSSLVTARGGSVAQAEGPLWSWLRQTWDRFTTSGVVIELRPLRTREERLKYSDRGWASSDVLEAGFRRQTPFGLYFFDIPLDRLSDFQRVVNEERASLGLGPRSLDGRREPR